MKPQIVRTLSGWHGRIVASNGEPLWTTEVLLHRESVVNAFMLLGQLCAKDVIWLGATLLEDVDERPGDDAPIEHEVPC